jgi:tetratricopeptide (TPR) repeat protein
VVAMDKFDKILELLQKKNLTETEKKFLEQFAESDSEIKSFIQVYNVLDKNLSIDEHIPTDLLSDFILFEKGDEPENKIIPLVKQKVKSHLEKCSRCKDDYDMLLDNYNDVKEHVNNTSKHYAKSAISDDKGFLSFTFKKYSTIKYAFATFVLFIVGYFGLFIISSSLTPDYNRNIFNENDDSINRTRGRTSVLFQQGLNAIDNSEYQNAIEFFSEDIAQHPNEQSIFYSYYIIGITYLKDAESGFIGLFKSYDRDKVNLAIENLKTSIEKNNSSDYENLKLDSYYYLGRAYLLNNNLDSAYSSFQEVIDGKGRFFNEANELIEKLEMN